jgi:hypothetical protein
MNIYKVREHMNIVADGVIWAQPACPGKWKMCKEEERVNSNTDLMYIHVFQVSCRVVVMFTCTLVRSHPDSSVKLEPLQ